MACRAGLVRTLAFGPEQTPAVQSRDATLPEGEEYLMTTLAGLEVKPSEDMTRIEAVCEHQRGLIYVVPAERSWVCTPDSMPAHALAGFFRELVALKSPEVEELMRQWGLYYRQLPAPQDTETVE